MYKPSHLASILALFSLLVLSTDRLNAQDIDWDLEIMVSGLLSTEDSLPFWMVANQNRQFGPMSNFGGLIDGQGRYYLNDNSYFESGTAWFYRDDVETEFQRRDLYLTFKNRWLHVQAGSKRDEIKAQGLSASNKDFLVSGNARPLSGLLIEANNPLRISNTFGIDWGIAHYSLNDDRYVSDVWVHYKHLALVTRFNEDHALVAKLTHYAQWAGTSPVFGDLPDDFSAFIDVFFARKASEDTGIDQENANAVGNHLGSYILDYVGWFDRGRLNIYHEHPFEDGSGTRLANFPDGIWGVHWKWDEHSWLSGILYEYIRTTNQSGQNNTPSGADSYFSNSLYRSGWSYESTIIGLPFILIDPDLVITEDNFPVFSDRARVHHFGIKGHYRALQWTLKSSVATHFGTFRKPIDPSLSIWSNYLLLDYNTGIYGNIMLSLGLDTGNMIDTNFGAGLSYRYRF